ncbi:histidine kinase receptor of two-component system [Lithospermum erythrorhizon]|uniref:histidine kinase n=1 Tax=Lithospermum erythrorhizon TaxID=34254 RepID=A0AAV3PLN4_LITER
MRIAQSNTKCIEFVFEVSDSGVGIPKEKQKFVFENYVQVNEAKSGQEATGLGLGIVQSLVRLIGGEIGIMDKPWGERGTCFRFNAYFSSEPNENGDKEVRSFYEFAESELQQLSNTRVLPSVEWSSQVILFIQNDERGRIIKHFMENHGIKVFVVKDHRELCSHLRRIREGKLSLCYHSSSGHSDSSTPRAQKSCPKSKDIPLSSMDGRMNSPRNTSSFNLILIDTSSSAIQVIHEVLREFRREIGFMHSRVVWMKKCGTQSIEVEDLDDSTDVIVSKPLHGSRLNQILKLLPEYGGLMHSTKQDLTISNSNNTTSDFTLRGCDGLHTQRPMIGKRVLVAEDNLVQQMVTKQVLSKLGAEVDSCQTGAKAVELVSNGLKNRAKPPYAYIFMDCKMEGMDGFEASRHIREEEQKYGVHVPIIALTSHVVEDVTELIKEAGMDHYLSKPLKREQLLDAIELLKHLVG